VSLVDAITHRGLLMAVLGLSGVAMVLPDIFTEVPGRVALTLAGHTHRG